MKTNQEIKKELQQITIEIKDAIAFLKLGIKDTIEHDFIVKDIKTLKERKKTLEWVLN